MRYCWKPYCDDDAELVDSWLDDHAIRETGLDDGWQHFYDYWMTESRTGEGKDCCFLISHEKIAFAVMYIAIVGCEMMISEYLLAPDMRGRGHGTAVIKELLDYASRLLDTKVTVAKAVIFPNNIASIKAFEKAGFVLVSKYHDDFGDGLHYEYVFHAGC